MTMPLPRLCKVLWAFWIDVLARMCAALRNDVVETNDLAVSEVPATFSRIGLKVVGRLSCVPTCMPLVTSWACLVRLLCRQWALFGLAILIPCSTR